VFNRWAAATGCHEYSEEEIRFHINGKWGSGAVMGLPTTVERQLKMLMYQRARGKFVENIKTVNEKKIEEEGLL
jgi:hypothetical protein